MQIASTFICIRQFMFVKEFNDGNQAGKCRSIDAHQPLFYKLRNRYEKEQIAKHAVY